MVMSDRSCFLDRPGPAGALFLVLADPGLHLIRQVKHEPVAIRGIPGRDRPLRDTVGELGLPRFDGQG